MIQRRHLTILEVFLLTLVEKAGVKTVYALQSTPGLTWGGIRPSLQRLERWRLIARSDKGKFGRREFSVTADGKRSLRGGWRERIMDETGADLETVTRALWFAGVLEPRIALRFLRKVVAHRRRLADQLPSPDAGQPTSPAASYVWMRNHCRKRQLEAEAEALEELQKRLVLAYPQPPDPAE